jgi:hypothetical protein
MNLICSAGYLKVHVGTSGWRHVREGIKEPKSPEFSEPEQRQSNSHHGAATPNTTFNNVT